MLGSGIVDHSALIDRIDNGLASCALRAPLKVAQPCNRAFELLPPDALPAVPKATVFFNQSTDLAYGDLQSARKVVAPVFHAV